MAYQRGRIAVSSCARDDGRGRAMSIGSRRALAGGTTTLRDERMPRRGSRAIP